LGPSPATLHGIDESIELQSIVDAARTFARFLLMRSGTNEMPR
jgi:acetylornithine deacetylase